MIDNYEQYFLQGTKSDTCAKKRDTWTGGWVPC